MELREGFIFIINLSKNQIIYEINPIICRFKILESLINKRNIQN